jgi:hypothetical protein
VHLIDIETGKKLRERGRRARVHDNYLDASNVLLASKRVNNDAQRKRSVPSAYHY